MIKPQSINKKDVANIKIKINPDQEIVSTIRKGLKRTGGYCPCRRERTEATKCMCQEFKNQIADPGFEGVCHCMLYYKSLSVSYTHLPPICALRWRMVAPSS